MIALRPSASVIQEAQDQDIDISALFPSACTQCLAGEPVIGFAGPIPAAIPRWTQIGEWIVEVCSLPALRWKATTNERLYTARWSWAEYGTAGEGKLDLRAPEPLETGQVWLLRDVIRSKLLTTTPVIKGSVYGERVERIVAPREKASGRATWLFERRLEFWPTEETQTHHLKYDVVRSKTTFSGAGKQYVRQLPLLADGTAEWRVWGGYRSGRAWTQARLSVVHLLEVV